MNVTLNLLFLDEWRTTNDTWLKSMALSSGASIFIFIVSLPALYNGPLVMLVICDYIDESLSNKLFILFEGKKLIIKST